PLRFCPACLQPFGLPVRGVHGAAFGPLVPDILGEGGQGYREQQARGEPCLATRDLGTCGIPAHVRRPNGKMRMLRVWRGGVVRFRVDHAGDEHGRSERSQGGVGQLGECPAPPRVWTLACLQAWMTNLARPPDAASMDAVGDRRGTAVGRVLGQTPSTGHAAGPSNADPVPMTDRFTQALLTSALVLGIAGCGASPALDADADADAGAAQPRPETATE